ncbi:MAG: hypothetical protein ACRETI_05800 [Steroidobacteraceae bacterium]
MADFEKLGAFYIGRGYDAAKDALAAEPLMYDSRDLKTHAVCVGMTGSGKTGLCISLLEEAALDPASIVLERLRIAPRKADTAIGGVAVAWESWRAGADGFPRPASTL